MLYFKTIEYTGEPPKIVLPNGLYRNPLVASGDIPVTDLNVFEFFACYKFCNPGNKHNLPQIELASNGITEQTTFIGESVNIYNFLDAMRANSRDAKAKVFKIFFSDCGEHLSVIVSDDGEGLSLDQKFRDALFTYGNTTRFDRVGCSLAWGKVQLQRITGDIKYKGVGVDGKGASFEMSFLKKMPM